MKRRPTRALSTGAFVAGSSLASRFLALALLVPAARALSADDFGGFVLVVGLSVAVTGVAGTVFADLLASGIVLRPARTWRRAMTASVVLSAVGTVGAVAVSVVGTSATWPVGILLTVTGVVPFVAMHVLRGAGRPAPGAFLAFLALPAARLAAAAFALGPRGGDGLAALVAMLWATVVCSAVSCLVVLAGRPGGSSHSGRTSTVPERPATRALVAGVSVALAFLVIGQAAPVAVAAISGEAATGAYAPTARVCEALTAVGVGYQFVVGRSAPDPGARRLPLRVVGLLAVPYATAALAVVLVAPTVLPVLLGQGNGLVPEVAAPLIPAFFCTMVSAAEIQRLFLVEAFGHVTLASALAVAAAAVLVPVGTVLLGTAGAAGATALAGIVWWIALRAPDRARRAVRRVPATAGAPC